MPPKLLNMLDKSLEEARKMAESFGYRVEVLIPETRVNVWGEEERTGWLINPSRYAPDKVKVELDENGNVVSVNY